MCCDHLYDVVSCLRWTWTPLLIFLNSFLDHFLLQICSEYSLWFEIWYGQALLCMIDVEKHGVRCWIKLKSPHWCYVLHWCNKTYLESVLFSFNNHTSVTNGVCEWSQKIVLRVDVFVTPNDFNWISFFFVLCRFDGIVRFFF